MNLQHLALAALCLALSTVGHSAESASSQQAVISHTDIEQALAKPKTRGLRIQGSIESGGAAREMVDLNIPFELNSSELQPQAAAQLVQLESALKSQTLATARFLVAGHTDASGDANYNRQLSLRRAETVKRFLVATGIDAARLQCVGQGEDHPLMPDKPEDATNRRVEIRNLGENP